MRRFRFHLSTLLILVALGAIAFEFWSARGRAETTVRLLDAEFSPGGGPIAVRVQRSGPSTESMEYELWDRQTGQVLAHLSNHAWLGPARSPWEEAFAYSKTGRFLAFIAGDRLRVVDTDSQTVLWSVAFPADSSRSIGITEDGRQVVVTTKDAAVVARSDGTLTRRPHVQGHDMSVSPDGNTLATLEGRLLTLWDVAGDQPRGQVRLDESADYVDFIGEAEFYISNWRATEQLWDARTLQPVHRVTPPYGRWRVGGDWLVIVRPFNQIDVHSLRVGRRLGHWPLAARKARWPTIDCYDARISSDGRHVLEVGSRSAQLIDVDSGRKLWSQPPERRAISPVLVAATIAVTGMVLWRSGLPGWTFRQVTLAARRARSVDVLHCPQGQRPHTSS